MDASSRESLAQARERLGERTSGAPGQTLLNLGDELFAVARLLEGEPSLRRALSDPGVKPVDRAGLAQRLLRGKVSDTALDLVETVARLRWSRPMDLVLAAETLATEAAFDAAVARSELDNVEDELFRFARIVVSSAGLRSALTDSAAPASSKSELLHRLLGGRAKPVTERLVTRLVSAPRGRSLESGLESQSRLAAERRDRMVAIVTSAVPLSDPQKQRLGAALAKLYGRPMHLNLDVDPEVVGGIRVQVGDEVINGSIADRLEDATRRMAS
jgi:F-type H+-transporting ATPase subunit delta